MNMDNNVKNEQKKIAYKCLKNFGLMNNVCEEFKEKGTLYYSERQNQIFDGILYWVSNHPEWAEEIQRIEKEYGVLVYHAYLYHTVYGDVLDCLYVGGEDTFEDTIADSKDGIATIYAIDLTESVYSEFGYGQYKPKNGGITKIA